MPQTLTHSPADIVRRVLIDLGLGVDPPSTPWPVFASGEPDTPDNCITVYDTAGLDHGRSMIDGELFGHNGVQVRVRSNSHATGWTKADAIQTGMAKSVYQETVTISGQAYLVHAIAKIGDVLTFGKETPTSKRSLFTINALASIKEV